MDELYLVTGAAGHLGSAVTRKLLEQGKTVRILVLPNEKNVPDGKLELFRGDILDESSLVAFFEDPRGRDLVVIHCAGIVSIASGYDQKIYDVNVTGTKNVVDQCVRCGIKKLVYVSSVHSIPEKPRGECIREIETFSPGNVMGLYAKTKAEATAYVLAAAKRGLNASVVHPSGICGPYDYGRGHLTTMIVDYCKHRLTAAIRGGYDFVDVRDVADGIVSCCEKGRPGECYILSNRYCEVSELLHLIQEATGGREIKTILPAWFAKSTAPLAELYYKILRQPPLYTAYSIYTLGSNAMFSHAKATAQLGYEPRDLRQTIADTVTWLKAKGRLG